MQFIRALFRSNKKFVGTDLGGNKYYETIRESGKSKREIITNLKPSDYEHGSVPAAWEAWLRHRREDPPSQEELINIKQKMEMIQEKGRILEQKDKQLREMEIAEGLVAKLTPSSSEVQQKGHASSPFYSNREQYQEPTSTGTSFQPGTWTPNQTKGTNSSNDSKAPDNQKSETIEPEPWSPSARK